ncbi:MAG: DUF2007 domain-containing protein [Nitrospinaceae bacterium]
MPENLVTAATFSQPYEAHLAQQRLQEAGIPAFIVNEHTISINWLYSNALGGVQVQVPEDRVQEARGLLAEDRSRDMDPVYEDPVLCPSCGSFDTDQKTVRKLHPMIPLGLSALMFFVFGAAFILLVFPLFFGGPGVHCHTCGRDSYTGKWPLRKIGTWAVLGVVILVGCMFLNGAVHAWRVGYSWREMDWNQDGSTSIREVVISPLVFKQRSREPDCFDYFNLRTGRKLKRQCLDALPSPHF